VALFLHSAINHRELLFCFFPILRTKKLESWNLGFWFKILALLFIICWPQHITVCLIPQSIKWRSNFLPLSSSQCGHVDPICMNVITWSFEKYKIVNYHCLLNLRYQRENMFLWMNRLREI
jgi:hypothetical protein